MIDLAPFDFRRKGDPLKGVEAAKLLWIWGYYDVAKVHLLGLILGQFERQDGEPLVFVSSKLAAVLHNSVTRSVLKEDNMSWKRNLP